MKAWTIDAAKILQTNTKPDLEMAEVITTSKIRLFLERDDLNFVVAPKGFGKTLLLLAKRLQYHQKAADGFVLIPRHGLLLDVPKGGAANLEWSNEAVSFFADRRNWEGIWRVSLSMAIVRTIENVNVAEDMRQLMNKLFGGEESERTREHKFLRLLLEDETLETPLDFLNAILTTFNKGQLRGLLRELRYLDQIVARLRTPIAIFIDNVDEYFEEYLEKGQGHYTPSARGVFDPDIWHLAQQGLIFAVRTMCRNNHHLDIFVSIRKEAYAELRSTVAENLRGSCIDGLEYSKANLRDIFDTNVRRTDHVLLFDPGALESNTLMAVCGLDRVHHNLVDRDEDLFDYIFRHTLRRPRDIMRIGWEIVQMDRSERTPAGIKKAINMAARETAKDYIKLSLPHTRFGTEEEFYTFLSLIPHNILTGESLRTICSCVNGGCDDLSCPLCMSKHPFCDLFRLGLLGTVEYDTVSQQHVQQFLPPGRDPLGQRGILPINRPSDLDFYLIHPMLNELIGGDARVRVNASVIIGHQETWCVPLLPKVVQRYKIFLSYAHSDGEFSDRLVRDLRKAGVHVWRDRENLQMGQSFLDGVKGGIEECEYFGIVISAHAVQSGWVAKELKHAIQHEIERMKITILPILLDEAWSQVPTAIRYRAYADFRGDYQKAFELLCQRLNADPIQNVKDAFSE